MSNCYFEEEGWQNGYCTSLENWRPQGLGGSNPSPSVLPVNEPEPPTKLVERSPADAEFERRMERSTLEAGVYAWAADKSEAISRRPLSLLDIASYSGFATATVAYFAVSLIHHHTMDKNVVGILIAVIAASLPSVIARRAPRRTV